MHHAFIISVPHLHTERLRLREYRVEDFDLFADHLSNPESSTHLGSADRHTAWRIIPKRSATRRDDLFPAAMSARTYALKPKRKVREKNILFVDFHDCYV